MVSSCSGSSGTLDNSVTGWGLCLDCMAAVPFGAGCVSRGESGDVLRPS